MISREYQMWLDLNPLLFYTSEFRYVEWNFDNLLGIVYGCHLKRLLEIFGFIPIYFASSSIFNEVYINWIWVFVFLEIWKWKTQISIYSIVPKTFRM